MRQCVFVCVYVKWCVCVGEGRQRVSVRKEVVLVVEGGRNNKGSCLGSSGYSEILEWSQHEKQRGICLTRKATLP